MEVQKRILIVEDDEDISMVEEAYLESAGFATKVVSDGGKVLEELAKSSGADSDQQGYDLILLDLMLPGKNGYELCKEIRKTLDIPILMVTARTESVDKIRGFGSGADDYISKPFDPAELVARVHANLRQYDRLLNKKPERAEKEPEIRIQDVRILTDGWKVFKGEREVKFTNREFELLKFMAMNPNIVFSKEQLFEKIWGYDYMGDSATVMVHINRIREKVEDDSKNPKILTTVWGAGYRLNR